MSDGQEGTQIRTVSPRSFRRERRNQERPGDGGGCHRVPERTDPQAGSGRQTDGACAQTTADLVNEWSTRADDENFALAASTLPKCFLYEGIPVDLTMKMKTWKRKQAAGEMEIPAEAIEGFENVTNWDEGYRKGLDAYQKVWRKWRFEPPKSAPPSPKEKPEGEESAAPVPKKP